MKKQMWTRIVVDGALKTVSKQMTGSWFGRDNDMFSSEDGLSFHSNFRGIWLALNDCKLYVTPVEDTEDYIIFTAPISLNGERTNLRFAFIWDDSTFPIPHGCT